MDTSGANVERSKSSVSLQTCMWIGSSDGATEFRYVVDLNKREVGPETIRRTAANQAPECAKVRAERQQRDGKVYSQIAQRFNDQRGRAELDKDLVEAIQSIEDSTKAGYLRANWISASPDNSYALYTGPGKPLLLIDVATLSTRVLAKADPYLRTPAAWSADSRFVAFAPPGTDQLQIYGTEEHAVVSTKSGAGQWVEALSWSPDMQHIAAFSFQNRRMNKTPLGLLGAAAGHPEFRNDGVLDVYSVSDEKRVSLVLKRGVSEMSSPNIEFEWK